MKTELNEISLCFAKRSLPKKIDILLSPGVNQLQLSGQRSRIFSDETHQRRQYDHHAQQEH
jgi:hypothetical protein